MFTFYNPKTKATYEVVNGKITSTVRDNRFTTCKICGGGGQVVQAGDYAGMCRPCRRKQYYKDNKERENQSCKNYYRKKDGRLAMLERRHGGNYIKRLTADNFRCVVCDKNRDLTIHHRDKTGMKSTGTYKKSNNNIDNLVTVCRKCHSNHHFKKTNPLLLPVC